MKNIFNRLNLNLVTISLLIIVIIPLNLARSHNETYTSDLFISLISVALILSLILITFSILLININKKLNIYSVYSFLVGLLLIWVFITGNFFPVSGIPGPFSLDLSVRLRSIILFKIVFILLFYVFLIKKDKKNLFFQFVYFFVLANFIFLTFNYQNNNNNNNHKYSLSEFGKKNLIVLSYDGISGHKMFEEVIKDKNFYQKLKDFKFYKNTVAGGPYTDISINIEINGKFETDETNNILNNKDINTLIYGSYISSLLDKSKGVSAGLQDYGSAFEVNTFFQNYITASIGRWATPLSVILIEQLKYTNEYIDFINLISFKDNNKPNPYNFIKSNLNLSLYENDIIFDNIVYNKDLGNVIRMYHFSFSHWPITINENCEEVKSLSDTVSSYDHESIALKCISKKIIKFLDNLKKNKVYNNSMIIIKSDHAKPNCIERTHTKEKISNFFGIKKCNKYYKDYPYSEKLNNNYYWGFGRYKPFIMIKDVNQNKDEIEISNKQVFLHDLSATYCNFMLNFKECNYLKKNNLIEDEEKFSIYNYDIYIPKPDKPLSTTNLNDLKKYTMSNDVTFLNFLKLNKIISSDQ
tara:strand:+ start:117 stop:1865 length:1749 start_codon:yes stop_codon:yes gene_type:complete